VTLRRVALGVVALALAGCGGSSQPPTGDPTVVGTIAGFEDAGSRMLVDDGSTCRISFDHGAEKRILRDGDDGSDTIEWADLRPGDGVRVWLDGLMSLGCPARGRAAAIAVEAD